ncbi:MAG TPA: lactate utilization protein B [Verrucomicrobiae bacterium]|nr:lactate utilization protein B [Verrucomicrobiae bacterium]
MKIVDQAENAAEFIEDQTHEEHLDKLLWMLRVRRDEAASRVPEWEQLRDLASQIKEHTLSNLAHYLEMFESRAQANGVTVHWARDAHEHNQIVYQLLSERNVNELIKSKSMLTEECDTRKFLEERGILVSETDLGERIQQLDDQPPSHIVGPAWHKTEEDIARVFAKAYGSDEKKADPVYLAQVMRENTRPLIERARAGMTGCNFAVAETGAIVTVTNEGNADLSGNVPELRICSTGIEKIIPKTEDLAVFIRLLTRSATGNSITQYTSHFRAPRQNGEMHIILVDNGRSERLGMEKFWPSLKCIRCAACMNTCPVYRRSGGLSYGSTYMGPIGIILMPTFDSRRFSELPYASTLNGSCTNVCPVKINIHEQIYAWREVMEEKHQINLVKKAAMIMAGKVLSHPEVYRLATAATAASLKVLPHFALYNQLNAWGRHRDNPQPGKETFHTWYKKNRKQTPGLP